MLNRSSLFAVSLLVPLTFAAPAAAEIDADSPGDTTRIGPKKSDPAAEAALKEAAAKKVAALALRVEALRSRGADFCDRGQLDSGITSLTDAWMLKHSGFIAGDLGACELKASRFRDAAEHMAFALRNPPEGDQGSSRARLEPLFTQARTKVGGLTITVDVDGADVFVGDRFVGTAPIADGEVYVEPGDLTVSLKKPGYGEIEKDVSVEAGGSAQVSMELRPKEVTEERRKHGKSPVVPILLGSLGVVAGVTGGVLFVVAGNKGTDAAAQLAALQKSGGNVPCGGTNSSSTGCITLKDTRASHDTFVNAGTGLLIGGGAALALGVVFAIRTYAGSSDSARVSVLPMVTPTSGGLSLQAAF